MLSSSGAFVIMVSVIVVKLNIKAHVGNLCFGGFIAFVYKWCVYNTKFGEVCLFKWCVSEVFQCFFFSF